MKFLKLANRYFDTEKSGNIFLEPLLTYFFGLKEYSLHKKQSPKQLSLSG